VNGRNSGWRWWDSNVPFRPLTVMEFVFVGMLPRSNHENHREDRFSAVSKITLFKESLRLLSQFRNLHNPLPQIRHHPPPFSVAHFSQNSITGMPRGHLKNAATVGRKVSRGGGTRSGRETDAYGNGGRNRFWSAHRQQRKDKASKRKSYRTLCNPERPPGFKSGTAGNKWRWGV
jgi:hypothetical protein